MTCNDIRTPEPESPQRVVLTSLAQLLLRWRYVILVPIALVYLSTLAILTNRQNLDVANQPNLYAQKRRKATEVISRSECTFCKGEKGIPNLDLVVPQAGGNTCRSIQLMAATEMKGSDKCAILQKEEGVCCPRSSSPTKTIFVISLQGTPGAHESNQGRLDLFKEKWRMACGSSSDSTNIEHCPAAFDKRRGYGVTLAWILCLWRARQLDEEVAIFLEDDARLFQNSTQEFCDVDKRGELLSKLPSDTFVAWLGGHTWSYEDSAVPYRRVRNSYGAYGFLVPRNSIDDFYAALQHGLIHGSKDRKQNVHHNSLDPEPNFYRAAREHNKKIYAFNPLVVWHEGGYSNTWGKVRGNITGLDTGRHGIKVGSGMTNTKDRKRSVDAGHQRAVEQIHSKHLPLLSSSSSSVPGGATTRCTFCEGETVIIPSLDLVVPKTGGQTCRSIKSMTATEIEGSAMCSTLQKEEKVCCPDSSSLQSLRQFWTGYRLADGVKGYDRKISNKHDVCKRWPGSILCEYLKRTDQKKDISTLADIVRHWGISEWGDLDKPSANTTVIHLRLGDGLCGRYDEARLCRTEDPRNRSCWDNVADCFKSTNGLLYAYPKEYFEPVAADLLNLFGNTTRIVIVADPSHWGRNKDMRNGDYSVDYAYRDNVVSFFRSKGFITQVRKNSGRPDDDFIYMSSAQSFVRGGGDFSRYVAEVVIANGGRVFEPSDTTF